ncbi:hypothetical protein ACWC2H_27550 [Streptomyces sp. 900105755]
MNLSLGVRVLIFVVCFLFSVLVSIGAGWMSHKPGSRKRDAVLFGGGAFIGIMTLCLAVLGALGVLSGGTA